MFIQATFVQTLEWAKVSDKMINLYKSYDIYDIICNLTLGVWRFDYFSM